ncbi:uncharacterized protein LOC123679795 [Harmonia axyridis]|uniref:uncharacterized protein LOC123679795 n=1 Tax=Harmonia axyridis TaxID=115357 RepID=UPI001E2769AE|nr:uncharacterized protein LOC123679795 [Harmonia axyridis]XP_045473239.1 uncharacterized protein LOC123679795 [Harmonia axyridis]XP_045473240.1 uncharacterized protein LOC123679795 [Harmonia axyridis]XP_045473241.1 uncharacterized protein LOC123679795 [Harmonia axyridis]
MTGLSTDTASLMATIVLLNVFFILADVSAPSPNSNAKCKKSEFTCNNGRCVPSNSFCNNVNDCGDSSDEPRYCTRCNRTYSGVVGITYELELHRPKADKIPFICHLTFTAAGDDYGDLVQLTFDSFTLGRFESFTSDGCPDGALQIAEVDRPQVGGSWCGTTWTPAIYYSETNSVIVSVHLLRLAKDQAGYNFDFRMEYKFLRRNVAIVRYGGGLPHQYFSSNATISTPSFGPEPEYYLGDLITGTYCSRIFSDCDKKHCRLQSPNFPGVYPRNLTCYYAVRQHEVPAGKHALITVRQPKGQLIYIRSQAALYGTASTRELKVWDDCNDVQDYVTVYDGYTTRDPVILKFCGGGEAVPEAISSGHELLVEFSTSPYGTFSHPIPSQSLYGFQLEVEVKFIDQRTPSFVKTKRQCEFWIRGTNKGVLESPMHSLPANTTCLYHLQGIDTSVSASPVPFRPLSSRYPDWRHVGMILPPPRYRVWLSIVKFHVAGMKKSDKPDQEVCRSYLNVWDGQLWAPTNCDDLYCTSIKGKSKGLIRTNSLPSSSGISGKRNVSLLARYCREHVPKSCDHVLLANATRFPRPCNLAESFLTSGDSLTLELKLADSTALRPVRFRALYEFVDLHLDGEPWGSGPCSRRFTMSSTQDNVPQKFVSPKDIFLYGRGGAKSLSCVYRFEAQKDEKVKLTLTDVVFKNRNCVTKVSRDTGRLMCEGNATAAVRIFEIAWLDVPGVPRDCLCSVDKDKFMPFTYVSTTNVIELRFDVTGMNATDDFTTLFFEGTWKFIRTPTCSRDFRMKGANGEVSFNYPSNTPDQLNCENNPRVIVPSPGKYLYVKINGVILRHSSRLGNGTSRVVTPIACGTSNRIIVHTALYSALVCPYEHNSRHSLVEVFSEGWTIGGSPRHSVGQMTLDKVEIDSLGKELSRSVVVEFLGKEDGSYSVLWLELGRRREIPPNGQGLYLLKPDECQYRCPELDACINASVWCDGQEDCPSGVDEAITHCSVILQLPAVYLFFGTLAILAIGFGVFVLLYRTFRRRPRSILQTRLKSLSSSDTAIIDDKGVIC